MEINKCSQNYNCVFLANIHSPKLRFKQDDFFVRIKGYGRNKDWAKIAKTTADNAVNMIRNDISAENLIKYIAAGIRKANVLLFDIAKVSHSGVLRDFRDGWLCKSNWTGMELYTNYSNVSRYKVYKERLDKVIEKPVKNPFNDIDLTVPVLGNHENFLKHANYKSVNNALQHIFKKYNYFRRTYNYKDINNSQMKYLNDDIAEIRWVMAHSTPWERGSDAISNVLMRAMYKSLGIKTYPLKKGISLDMEAYCTGLNDYKRSFPKYFEKPPEIID